MVAARRRLRRIERRELSEFRRWIQNTTNLLHVSVVVVVPVLLAVVTSLSNRIQVLSFLLFPPLAAGTYTLFSDPEGRYANPIRFVASLTAGAVCGLASYSAVAAAYGGIPVGVIRPESAALAVFLTGIVTWAGRIESPSAFSTALLALVTGEVDPVIYVVSIALASSFVAAVFWVWRGRFYERRAEYLYETVRGDDHVLVPMYGEAADRAAFFGARLAAAHEAGKVVLLELVSETDSPADDETGVDVTVPTASGVADGSERFSINLSASDDTDRSVPPETAEVVARLEQQAAAIRTEVGVPVEVAVVAGPPVGATLQAAREANCDLVVMPHEVGDDAQSAYLRGIFGGPIDAVAFRSRSERRRWRRVLVLVARPGDTAHGMIDFATRQAGTGTVSVTTCIDDESERRRAETRLEHLVETADGNVETRVARTSVGAFVDANAGSYDLLVVGSSGERSPASRLVSPPTFGRLEEFDCDVAVFNRGIP
ncbi:universal stress protein UspA [Halobellus salinus]|uniref:Universal stress protein UspA n=1 Tax=Halobellus salinus TaxID=931585 RepID=A0A830EAQ6_9EURY|nr:universal stress protein UspA [Halobellus salinus]